MLHEELWSVHAGIDHSRSHLMLHVAAAELGVSSPLLLNFIAFCTNMKVFLTFSLIPIRFTSSLTMEEKNKYTGFGNLYMKVRIKPGS